MVVFNCITWYKKLILEIFEGNNNHKHKDTKMTSMETSSFSTLKEMEMQNCIGLTEQ